MSDKILWSEFYRPKTIADCILPDPIKKMVQEFVDSGEVPNFIFAGAAGCGKTSLIKAIVNELDADLLYINASLETSIDVIRDRVVSFSSSVSLSGSKKIVLLDECLSEDEKIRIGVPASWKAVPLKELEHGVEYPVVSFNEETKELESDVGYIISDRMDDLFEVELEDGSIIVLNGKHPFMCEDVDGIIVQRTIEEGLTGYKVLKF